MILDTPTARQSGNRTPDHGPSSAEVQEVMQDARSAGSTQPWAFTYYPPRGGPSPCTNENHFPESDDSAPERTGIDRYSLMSFFPLACVHRLTCFGPGFYSAVHMGHARVPHLLQGVRSQRRATAGGCIALIGLG